jgi:2-amino-4-hydroxy-6-hydroxymethyldihydropteridine diphosphokinase
MPAIYLALGTNLGDRLANLAEARANLLPQVKLVRSSPIYETKPWGYSDQPDFLNQVLQVETDLEPEVLLAYLKRLEAQLGRQPTLRNGPRLIDIDILFYGDMVYQSPTLTIPHPQLTERAFVLIPLADLAPDLIHPVSGQTIRNLQSAVGRKGISLFPETQK